MYDWIQGRPPLILRERDLARWPGKMPSSAPRPNGRHASIHEFAGSPILVLREPLETTVVPLELGGALLVSAARCDGDAALMGHLDMMPVTGWEPLPERFRVEDERYVLFDGGRAGSAIRAPAEHARIGTQHGVVPITLVPGTYEIETLGPWTPDPRTELWLTRLVRSA